MSAILFIIFYSDLECLDALDASWKNGFDAGLAYKHEHPLTAETSSRPNATSKPEFLVPESRIPRASISRNACTRDTSPSHTASVQSASAVNHTHTCRNSSESLEQLASGLLSVSMSTTPPRRTTTSPHASLTLDPLATNAPVNSSAVDPNLNPTFNLSLASARSHSLIPNGHPVSRSDLCSSSLSSSNPRAFVWPGLGAPVTNLRLQNVAIVHTSSSSSSSSSLTSSASPAHALAASASSSIDYSAARTSSVSRTTSYQQQQFANVAAAASSSASSTDRNSSRSCRASSLLQQASHSHSNEMRKRFYDDVFSDALMPEEQPFPLLESLPEDILQPPAVEGVPATGTASASSDVLQLQQQPPELSEPFGMLFKRTRFV